MHREQRHWSQTELARMLGTTYLSVCRWENGVTSPSLYFRKQLCDLFGVSAEELGLVITSAERSTSTVSIPSVVSHWNVPYRRNPFFTGRQHILSHLHTLLHTDNKAALMQVQAISGLGGIGKTQTAVEYAYRFRDDYQAILWVRAETRSTLMADLVSIADLLDLAEKDEQDQERIVQATKRWLQNNTNWLLILDNAEDLSIVEDVLPTESSGHVIVTTRTQSTGIFAQRIDLERMEAEEGALFLLRRAKMIAPDAPLEASAYAVYAKQISELLDGLPLALDQAGAYIEETECSLQDYLDRYQMRRAALLERRGRLHMDHPDSVNTTLSLSLEKVEHANPAAIELLKFCAFLEPDAIPEEIITDGALELGPILASVAQDPFMLDAAIADLRRYSLLRRNPDLKTLTVHRLVQAVLKDGLEERTRLQWIERGIRAANRVFPEGEFTTWQRCQRCLPQVQTLAVVIEEYNLSLQEAAQLLNKAGWYLVGRALYAQAEPLLQRALTIRERVLGLEHPDTASTLNNLAVLYFYQGRYEQAEQLLLRALVVREHVLGSEHPDIANTLDTMALVYYYQGRYVEAEPLYQHALVIEENTLGPEHLDTGATLNNLALLYQAQGRYAEAEPLYQRVLEIHRKTLGSEHPYTAIALDNLAKLYYVQGRYGQAEPLYQQALVIEEKVVGLEHSSTAITTSNLGQVYHAQGRYEDAGTLYRRALAIQEKVLGPENSATTYILVNLARLDQDQGQNAQAESLFRRARDIADKNLGPEHPQTATILDHLAQLYESQCKYEQARPLYQQALNVREKRLGAQHPETVATRERYTALVEKMTQED
jgi:tetratricopeptide (TPR) repeat protein/DNA-binding XRE family transcriptional regulator